MVEKTKGFVEKGLSTEDKGTYIPLNQRAPHRPEYSKMPKAEVVKAEEKRRADEQKIEQYRNKLKNEDEAPKEEATEAKPESATKKAASKSKK